MKKYRLKKDTFLAKKGGLFREVNESGVVYLQRIKPDGSDLFTKIAKDPIIDFDEWFEEVKEFEEWRPKEREVYKCISLFGRIDSEHFVAGNYVDKFRLSVGNCYPTDTPDDLIIKEQKLIPQAMHRLKMAAKKAWFEFNGSEGPDWDDCRSCHWRHFICFDRETYRFYVNGDDYQQIAGVVYFPTRKSCQAYIDNNPEDMKLLFGVER